MAPLLSLGLPAASYYFLPRNRGNEGVSVVTSLIILFVVSLGFGIFASVIAPEFIAQLFANQALEETLPWLSVFAPAMLIAGYVLPSLIAIEQAKLSEIYQGTFRLCLAGLVVGAALLVPSAISGIAVQAVVSLAAVVIGIAHIWKKTTSSSGMAFVPRWAEIRNQLKKEGQEPF